jgi:hypothetical protein
MTRSPTAAEAFYGHLPSAEPAPPPRLAEALYPALAPKPPAPPKWYRDLLLKDLRTQRSPPGEQINRRSESATEQGD